MTQLLYFTGLSRRSDSSVGRIEFLSQRISVSQIAGGALLRLNYIISLERGLQISMSGITGEIRLVGMPSYLSVGIGVDPQCHVIDTDREMPGGQNFNLITGCLQLSLTLAALETIERWRDRSPPEFDIALSGSVFVRDNKTELYEGCRLQADSGTVRLRADRDNWIQQVRNVSPLGSVLIEIPLAMNRSGPLATIWKCIDNASENLGQGGEAGWTGCLTETRKALEAWNEIDPIPAPPEKGREKDKRQRLYDLAEALRRYCHLSAHFDKRKENWTRADAILALATLCALLSARNL
jgi:hypothetical protein